MMRVDRYVDILKSHWQWLSLW